MDIAFKNSIENVKALPRTHLIILGICAGALLLFIAAHFILIRPVAENVTRLHRNLHETKTRLKEEGWPLEVGRLQTAARQKKHDTQQMTKMKDRVVRETTTLFKNKIAYMYETWQHFEDQVSRLDYQQEFLRVERKFSNAGIKMHEHILGLSDNSTGFNTYELVLQLWAFEAATDKALAYSLTPILVPVTPPQAINKDASLPENVRKASAITVLPPTPYYLHPSEKSPYLLEFGVQLQVKGKVSDLHDFLHNASAPPDFLGVTRIELQKPLPDSAKQADDIIEAEIICTAYYLLDKEVRAAPTQNKKQPLPAGA